MTGSDVLPLVVVGLVTAVVTMALRDRYAAWEFQLVLASLVAHVVATFVQIWMVLEVYGYGDMLMYRTFGRELSAALQRDLLGVLPGVLKILFHQENTIGVFVPADGSATGSMVALTGLMQFLLGNSFYAVSVAFAMASFFGKLAMYEGFRIGLPHGPHRLLLLAAMLIPSCVFWSSGIIKEAVTMAGLGLLVLGAARWIVRGRPQVLLVAAGAVIAGVVKPYILFAFALSGAVWVYGQRASVRGEVRIRPVPLIGAAVAGAVGLVVLGWLFPQYSLDAFAEEAADLQFAGTRFRGGSSFVLGDPTRRTLWGQLAFAPVAVFTALYRPAIFDVANAQMLVNAAETTLLLAVTVHAVVRHSPLGVWRVLRARPMLMFCLAFVAVMSLAVGLTSSNLGTLSRYRMPMYPFFAAILAVLVATPPSRQRSSSDR